MKPYEQCEILQSTGAVFLPTVSHHQDPIPPDMSEGFHRRRLCLLVRVIFGCFVVTPPIQREINSTAAF